MFGMPRSSTPMSLVRTDARQNLPTSRCSRPGSSLSEPLAIESLPEGLRPLGWHTLEREKQDAGI